MIPESNSLSKERLSETARSERRSLATIVSVDFAADTATMLPTDLIAGPYHAPVLRKGDRTFCLYRDAEAVVTSWTAARIPWPRCRARASRGGSGLLVTEELLRAIRTESASAIKFWFGVGTHAVWRWRQAFGVGQWGSEGSRRLLEQNTAKANEATRGKPLDLTAEQRSERSKRARKSMRRLRREGRLSQPRTWTAAEMALLGSDTDGAIAEVLGLSRRTVQRKREALGIEAASHRRWTAAEDQIVRKCSIAEAARRTGRTCSAVESRRVKLQVRKAGRDT